MDSHKGRFRVDFSRKPCTATLGRGLSSMGRGGLALPEESDPRLGDSSELLELVVTVSADKGV